jgi:genome maintenance exonuclease 1
MKNFIVHDVPQIKQINSEGGRVYLTPDGKKYPSVTSVLSLKNTDFVAKWKKRVGEEEAQKITKRAAGRGSAVHELCETYLKTGTATPDIFDVDMFKSLLPFLNKVDNIHCSETRLFSHHLQVAGTVDLIAEYEGTKYVIDFKTSLRPKKFEWIHGYFMQMSAYAVMFEELTGVCVPNLLVVIAIDDHEPQMFFGKRNKWIFKFRELREQYRIQKGI